jgi:hypothetical protein
MILTQRHIPIETQRLAHSLDDRDITFTDLEDDTSIYPMLVDKGIILAYADAFTYSGKAIIICGPSGIGKTTISKMFEAQGEGLTRILAEDSVTLFHDGFQTPAVYEDDIGSDENPFLVPFLYPEESESFDLDAIIHLTDTHPGRIRVRDAQQSRATSYFLLYPTHTTFDWTRKKVNDALANTPVFEYGKNKGNLDSREMRRAYCDIKDFLDSLLN